MSATIAEDCLFCRIVSGEVPADVVAETGHSLAFRDIEAAAPTHLLVVPRRHVPDLAGLATAPPASPRPDDALWAPPRTG